MPNVVRSVIRTSEPTRLPNSSAFTCYCRKPYSQSSSLLQNRRTFRRIDPAEKSVRRPSIPRLQEVVNDEHDKEGKALTSRFSRVQGYNSPIKWYQQLTPWSKERRPTDPAGSEVDEASQETKWLKEEIDRLEDELELMRQNGPGTYQFTEPLLQDMSAEDRRKIKERMEADAIREEEESKALKQHLPKLRVRYEPPLAHRIYLRRFNKIVVSSVTRSREYRVRKDLWKSYIQCRAFLPSFIQNIPPATWDILYRIEAVAMTRNDPHWAPHLVLLLSDMIKVGQTLVPEQTMALISTLTLLNRQDEAIQMWQDLGKSTALSEMPAAEYELLGVRLFASGGDLATAEEIAGEYLRHDGYTDPRILIPIIDAWTQRRDESGMKHAWTLYLRLQVQLGSSITAGDFDKISMSFIKGGRTDLALVVFKDFILSGDMKKYLSLELYKRTMSIVGEMHEASISLDEVNQVSLATLTVLPKHLENKFFYASWTKALIGLGEPDAAAAVIDLMCERGVQPDPKHVNGVIEAWLRRGLQTDRAKAQKIAWSMIQQRIDMVESRQCLEQAPTMGISPKISMPPTATKCAVPPATIETLCLLLQFYGRRGSVEGIDRIQKALKVTQLATNNYWLNHQIFIELRRHRLDSAWRAYCVQAVQADLETFAALWDCEKASLTDPSTKGHAFPSHQTIMKEMNRWLDSLKPMQKEKVRAQFRWSIYHQIVRCASEAQDVEALILILHDLADRFGYYPTEETVQIVIKGTARIGLSALEPRHKGLGQPRYNFQRRAQRSQLRSRETNTRMALELTKFKRSMALHKAGFDDFEKLNSDVQAAESLNILSAYLKAIAIRLNGVSEDDLDMSLAKGAKRMNVRTRSWQEMSITNTRYIILYNTPNPSSEK